MKNFLMVGGALLVLVVCWLTLREVKSYQEKMAVLLEKVEALESGRAMSVDNEESCEEELIAEKALEVVEEVEMEEIPEILDSPVVLEEELAPVVEEEPEVVAVEEPQIEPVVEPEKTVEPAPRAVPQQTSLFGSAVSDIRQAISLGDRFLFQRELFAGNGELMQKTLDELNTLGSLDEAMEYVQENFEWDMECTAVKLFENVLKRRFN